MRFHPSTMEQYFKPLTALSPGKEPSVPLNRMVVEPQGRSGHFEKRTLASTGSRTSMSQSSSL